MKDVRQQIAEVRREVGHRTVESGEARVSVISQVYDTGIDDLWEAVTTPERIARWFLPVTGELKEGGAYQLEGNAGGTVTRCDKPNGYDATWEFGGGTSWIEVRLTPEGAGTRFELTHIGTVPDEMWAQFGPGATGVGWDGGFFGLANHLLDPSTAPDPASMADWHTTEDGKTFYRLCADAWGAAAIADGEDPAQAKAAADRTYGFYTGTEV